MNKFSIDERTVQDKFEPIVPPLSGMVVVIPDEPEYPLFPVHP